MEGVVEIGYAIASGFRGRGLATNAARTLIDRALEDERVRRVDAHTLAELNASTRVLEKVGMARIDTVTHPEAGSLWHWSRARP